MKEKDNHNYFIDLLKFVFSIIIVFYHAWVFAPEYGQGYFHYGYLAVDFYFITTGYLMMNSINKKKVKKEEEEPLGKMTAKFVFNKIKPIFPYILAAFLFGGFMLYGCEFFSYKYLLQNNYLYEILQLGILGKGFPINSATWYLSSMLLSLAVLYPLANKFKENYPTLIAPLLLVGFLLIVYSQGIYINNPLAANFHLMNGFYKGFIFVLIGNIIYVFVDRFKKVKFNMAGSLLITFIEMTLYAVSLANMQFNLLGTSSVAIILAIALIISFSNQSYTAKFLNFKVFKHLGTFGVVLYLNNIYVRRYILDNGLMTTHGETLILYLKYVFIISIVMFIFVPLVTKLFKWLWSKFKSLILIKE